MTSAAAAAFWPAGRRAIRFGLLRRASKDVVVEDVLCALFNVSLLVGLLLITAPDLCVRTRTCVAMASKGDKWKTRVSNVRRVVRGGGGAECEEATWIKDTREGRTRGPARGPRFGAYHGKNIVLREA